MYHIEDKSGAIKSVQRLLFISTSGVFDKKTRDAVMAFQASCGLAPTGSVDSRLFTLLRESYNNKKLKDMNPELNNFPYVFGDSGGDVAVLNANLTKVIKRYTYSVIRPPRGSFYSHDTKAAVSRLREVYRMTAEECVDEEFYFYLKEDLTTYE